MGKANYYVMIVRVKLLLFLRKRRNKKTTYQEKDLHFKSGSSGNNKRYINLPGIHGEYSIHINEDHITNFLN